MILPGAGERGERGVVRESPSPLWLVPAYLILFALLALWISTTFRLHIEPGDEGVTLLGASRIAAGEIPHEDFFEIIPPGSFLPVAGAFWLFGASVAVGRAVAAVYAVLLLLLMEWAGRRLGVSPFFRLASCAVLVPFGVWTWPMASHHWLADLLILGSLALLLSPPGDGDGKQSGGGRWAIPGSAALATWACFTLQDQGGYWTIILGAILLWAFVCERGLFTTLRRWFVWFAAFSGAALLLLFALAGPRALLCQWIVFPASRYRGISGNAGRLGNGWSEAWDALSTASGLPQEIYAVSQLFFHGVLLVAPLTVAYLLWLAIRRRERRKAALLLAGAQVAFYGACLHRWSALNMTWALPAGLLSLALLLDDLARSGKRPLAMAGRCAAALIMLIGLSSLFSGMAVVQGSPRFGVEGPGGRLESLDAAQAMALSEVVSAVSNFVPAGEPVFFSGYFPLLNVLSARPNPTRYNIFLVPEYSTVEQAKEVILTLRERRKSWVVLPMPVRPESIFDQEVLQNYRRVWTGSRFALFVREKMTIAGFQEGQ